VGHSAATAKTMESNQVKNTFIEFGHQPTVMREFAKRSSAPSCMISMAMDDDVPKAPIQVTQATVLSAPQTVTVTPPKLQFAPASMAMGQQRSMVMSPVGSTPMGMSQSVARSRVSTAVSGSSTNTGRRLSFEVPATPESCVWGGGSSGSAYSFGFPGMALPQPTISETAPATKTYTMPAAAPSVISAATAPATASTYPAAAQAQAAAAQAAFAANPYFAGGYGGFGGMPGMGGMCAFPGPGGVPMAYMPVPMPGMGMPYMMPPTTYGATALATGEGTRLELGSLIPTQARAAGAVTTIMLRNIPLKYTRETLLADLDARGFPMTYDFFYLPIDFHTGNNVGYAFINFLDEAIVVRFRATYNGLQLSADSAKICEVSDAKAQGKLKNVDQYRNSSVMSMEDRYQPVVFENGVRQLFPPPTRALKAVKPRARGAP